MDSQSRAVEDAERAARPAYGCGVVNVGSLERIASALVGGGLIAAGLYRRDLIGLVAALAGGGLVFRGASGHCMLYRGLGWNTALRHDAAIGVPPSQALSDGAASRMKSENAAVDEAGAESFPASDPPSFTATTATDSPRPNDD